VESRRIERMGSRPGTMPEREWKRMFITGADPMLVPATNAVIKGRGSIHLDGADAARGGNNG